jgi:two-component system, OmpR family, phosphate regulon sensor histidine kinase PhoR
VTELFGRVMPALIALVLGAAVGALVGVVVDFPTTLAVAGAALGVAWVLLRDAVHAGRLMAWLRGPQADTAPRDTGFWGEVAYRVEREVRKGDRAVAAERERLQQFLSAIDASPNGVMLLDATDRVEWINRVGAEHFGLDPQRDRLQRVTNLVRAPAFVSYLQDGEFAEPVRFSAPAGRATLSVIVRPHGEGMKLVLSQDITELERADAMRRDFVANVSHEIRSPLTVLAGFVETMGRLPLTEAERQRVLILMEQQTERMQALVGDLLELAKLEGSPRPPTDRWHAAGAMLRRAYADAMALSSGRHTIAIEGSETFEAAELAGSENELLSAVANLMHNAVRYTPEGGRVELLWAWRADGGAEISVTDSGPGIAREHLPRLTERFYRVDASRARDTGGTGLGLAIVKHVAQRHGGEIDIQSEVGKGSVFKLVLPALRVRRRTALVADAAGELNGVEADASEPHLKVESAPPVH